MPLAPLTIRALTARPLMVELPRAVRTASGNIPLAPMVLIDVHTEQGITGRAYAFGYHPATLKPLVTLARELEPLLVGQPVAPTDRWNDLQARFRLLGLQGLMGMLASTLDMAYWDALGQAAGEPVVRLLGGQVKPVKAYDSYGMVDPIQDERALRRSMEQGFQGIKIKVGEPDVARDIEMVRGVREIIGPKVALMVDFNQSLTPVEAIRRIRLLEPYDLGWIEEPVPAEDLRGHAQVRAAVNVPIQTGENWWFPRGAEQAVTAGACDLMMPDVMKIGGITGWIQTMGLAQAASIPMSSHLFHETSVHLLPVTPTAHWLEFLEFARYVLREPLEVVDGCVTPRGPGLGMQWDEAMVAKYAVA